MKLSLQTLVLLGSALVTTGLQPASDPAASQRLFEAVKAGNLAAVQKELPPTGKADVNTKHSDGYTDSTALMAAVLSGNGDIVNALIKAGADVNAKSSSIHKPLSGKTALILVVRFGNVDMANILIKAGADVNAKDSSGTTTLMWAVRVIKGDIVNALIKAGVDVNAKDLSGATALQYAHRTGSFDIVNALKAAGAK